ncbi:MAG: hypothetical protein IPO21_00595 [Bacteroidales bacterium]|nr:hypothetical protein [Bacteroidales bacterium]
MNRNLHYIYFFALWALLFNAIAQERTYPQNVTYPYGYKSSKITSADADKEYQSWISKYYVECSNNEARINYDGNTVSEGIGYGLVITAYAGDKTKFDKLLKYYNNRKNGNGVMHWEYSGCNTGAKQTGAATDGDLDAVMGMLVAVHQWPNGGYAQHFESLVNSIKNSEFTSCGLIVQKPGDAWGGCDCTNPSYYAPGYYRAFAKYFEGKGNSSTAEFWNNAAKDSYTVLFKNQNATTGLVSAWTNTNGAAGPCGGAVGGGGGADTYQYDACRTPWRIATDYLWWGDANAKTFLTRVVGFVNTKVGGIDKVVDGYKLDGTVTGQWHNVPFVGSFALSGMATSQADADKFMEHFRTLPGDNYFNTCLAVMYKFLATGNFWNPYSPAVVGPKCSQVNLGTDKSLCGSGQAILNAGVATSSGKTFTWYKNDAEIQKNTSNTYTATTAGTYKVVMDSAGKCSSEAKVIVSASLPVVNLGNDILLKGSATLDAKVEGSGINYKWYLDGTAISGATQKTLVIDKPGEYKVEVSATGCASTNDAVFVEVSPQIQKTSVSISTDGVTETAYTNFRNISKALQGNPNSTDLSAKWSAIWDNTNLYIVVQVTDNNLQNDSGDNWWDDDGVEIFIDGNNSKGSSYDNQNDFQWGFNYKSDVIRTGGSNPSNSTAGIQFKIVTNATGYTLEVAIPWTTIKLSPTVGATLGIDIAINDDDGGSSRENKIAWNATEDNGWQNPSVFGAADLVGEPVVEKYTQTIALKRGWNLISLYVTPKSSLISEVFKSVFSNIDIIKNLDYLYNKSNPSYLNSLKEIKTGNGYLVYANSDANVTVEGTLLASFSAQLNKGWNIIGYPFQTQKSIQETILEISSKVTSISNFNGVFQNGGGSIQNFEPSKGYYIKVTDKCTLEY